MNLDYCGKISEFISVVVGPEMLLDLLQVQFSSFASAENWIDCLKAFHSKLALALFIRNYPWAV